MRVRTRTRTHTPPPKNRTLELRYVCAKVLYSYSQWPKGGNNPPVHQQTRGYTKCDGRIQKNVTQPKWGRSLKRAIGCVITMQQQLENAGLVK